MTNKEPLSNGCQKLSRYSFFRKNELYHEASFFFLVIFLFALTVTTVWAFSADDKLTIFLLFFPENRVR